jgi:hypothetical protein
LKSQPVARNEVHAVDHVPDEIFKAKRPYSLQGFLLFLFNNLRLDARKSFDAKLLKAERLHPPDQSSLNIYVLVVLLKLFQGEFQFAGDIEKMTCCPASSEILVSKDVVAEHDIVGDPRLEGQLRPVHARLDSTVAVSPQYILETQSILYLCWSIFPSTVFASTPPQRRLPPELITAEGEPETTKEYR